MKARLEFDLPEEREEFEINRKAADLYYQSHQHTHCWKDR